MQLSNYLGLKLTDIGVDDDINTLWLEFTGGHKIHIKRDDINRAIILTKPNISNDELDDRKEEIKKARAEARAEKAAKAAKSKGTTVKSTTKKTTKKTPAKKTTKKATE